MPPASLDFWFEFASTYSYLAAMRLEEAASAAGVSIVLRPFLLGPIFAAQGLRDSPFNLYPARGRYMRRDMERLAAKYRLPLAWPSTFPRGSLLAARIAFAVSEEPWALSFVRAVYRANFAEDQEIGDPRVVGQILRDLGQDSEHVILRGQAAETKNGLRDQTAKALSLGIFGAPSFIVAGDLFWGNDRLEDALEACAQRGEAPHR
jgi:2-hydroxychromene-2-carboxylate isomerase